MNVKQVIVIRKDLNMRKGKMIAQGAHASMKVLLDLMIATETKGYIIRKLETYSNKEIDPLENWLLGKFTKIVVSVDSEKELLDIYNKAKENDLLCSLIQDAGLTEFNNEPTYTAVAIGPNAVEDIDNITGNLKLL